MCRANTLKHINILNPLFQVRHLISIVPFEIKTLSYKRCIVSSNQGGLCNRLKCLISCMRLADKVSGATVLSWPEKPRCKCKFSDIFENKIIEIGDKCLRIIRDERINIHKKYILVDTWRLLTLPNELPDNFAKAYHSSSGKGIDFEFERIPLPVREDFLIYINRLIPNVYIRNEVENFSKLFDDYTVSVCIRSWADRQLIEEKSRADSLFRIENVYAVIDKLDGLNFFVTCDSAEVLKKIIDRYGKRVLYYPRRDFQGDRYSKEAIRDALIELLLASRNKNLKIFYGSTFCEMVWWLGGCKAAVEIIDRESDIQNYLKKCDYRESLNLIPQQLIAFLNTADKKPA